MACLLLHRKEKRDLPQTHLEVYNKFINGNFTIRLKQGRADGVWSGTASEQIYHKEGKNNFSLRSSTEKRSKKKYTNIRQ